MGGTENGSRTGIDKFFNMWTKELLHRELDIVSHDYANENRRIEKFDKR